MKYYKFENFDKTWYAEYRVDGMQNSIAQKIMSIRSKSANVVNAVDLLPELIVMGLPNQVGAEFSEVAWKAFADEKNMTLVKSYEATADSTLHQGQNTEMHIKTFSFLDSLNVALAADVIGVVDVNALTVALTVPALTDVTALIASFTLSSGATAEIGVTAQVSGVTPNDFTAAVTYGITAEYPLLMTEWTVTVTIAA